MDYFALAIKQLCGKEPKYLAMRNMRTEDIVIQDIPTDKQLVIAVDWSITTASCEYFDKMMSKNELFIGIKDDIIYFTETTVNDKTYNCSYYYSDPHNTMMNRLAREIVTQKLADLLIDLLSKEEERERIHKEFYETIQKEAIEQALIGLASGFDARLKELEVNANTFKSRIAQYRADLVATSARLDQTMKDILNFDLEGEKDTIRKELVNIATHKKVDHITYESGFLCIYTVPLYLFEPIKKERFYLGKMVIKINTSSGSIRFDNLDNRRNGYWRNSPHPHVDDGGYGCLGNIDGQVADAFTRRQYYVLFITLLGYLETCNINDCAGARVHAWDMVDKNGKIITEGDEDCDDDEYDEYPTCTICGEEIEGEVIYCEDCDTQMHEDCAIYIEALDEWHCPTCAREHHDMDV